MDMTPTARKKRYQRYLQLKLLPYLDARQAKEFEKLKQQRKIDNQYAYQCSKHK